MVRFAFFVVALAILLCDVQCFRIKRQTHRTLQSQPRTPWLTADGVPILSESYVRSTARDARQNLPSQPDRGLSLYEDFVNDPWKPTQDLNGIISERSTSFTPQRELRSGHQDPRESWWDRRHHQWTTSTTTTERPGNEWNEHSRTGDHVTYVRRKSTYGRDSAEPLRGWQHYPHGVDGDGEWILESRSDGHITYRRRGSRPRQHWEAPPIQRLGHGPGEVLARVVSTSDIEDSQLSARLQSDPYRSISQDNSPGRPALQLRAGDSVQYRNRDGTEIVFPRYRDSDWRAVTVSPPTVRPEYLQQDGNWRVVSKDDSHITWTRVGSDYEYRGVRHGGSNFGTLTQNRPEPNYPMLNERETADKANRLGTSNVMARVH